MGRWPVKPGATRGIRFSTSADGRAALLVFEETGGASVPRVFTDPGELAALGYTLLRFARIWSEELGDEGCREPRHFAELLNAMGRCFPAAEAAIASNLALSRAGLAVGGDES